MENAPLRGCALRHVNVVARPGLVRSKRRSVVGAATTTAADLRRRVQVFNAGAFCHLLRSAVGVGMCVELLILERVEESMVRREHVDVPFSVNSVEVINRWVVGCLRCGILCFKVKRIRRRLYAAAPVAEVAVEGFRRPVQVFLVRFASNVNALQFGPGPGFCSVFLNYHGRAVRSVERLPFIRRPVTR